MTKPPNDADNPSMTEDELDQLLGRTLRKITDAPGEVLGLLNVLRETPKEAFPVALLRAALDLKTLGADPTGFLEAAAIGERLLSRGERSVVAILRDPKLVASPVLFAPSFLENLSLARAALLQPIPVPPDPKMLRAVADAIALKPVGRGRPKKTREAVVAESLEEDVSHIARLLIAYWKDEYEFRETLKTNGARRALLRKWRIPFYFARRLAEDLPRFAEQLETRGEKAAQAVAREWIEEVLGARPSWNAGRMLLDRRAGKP